MVSCTSCELSSLLNGKLHKSRDLFAKCPQCQTCWYLNIHVYILVLAWNLHTNIGVCTWLSDVKSLCMWGEMLTHPGRGGAWMDFSCQVGIPTEGQSWACSWTTVFTCHVAAWPALIKKYSAMLVRDPWNGKSNPTHAESTGPNFCWWLMLMLFKRCAVASWSVSMSVAYWCSGTLFCVGCIFGFGNSSIEQMTKLLIWRYQTSFLSGERYLVFTT